MSDFTLMPAGVTLDLPEGTTLLQAVLAAGGKFAESCPGAKCGACHVFVTAGRKGVSKMTPVENARLDSIIGVSGKSRLACQASLTGTEAVTVELLGALSG
ncbi:Ferredoxin, 2Fe-2S [Rubrivivax sp. A210]|uniref:2Fe-2S iron-sulfur cluster-binding protein n=1 Tax=Rubrivivax sp. A210 TaxID=2772301 RepID=UPI001919C5A9|nr:2Fe-2S iron-sulfur cluster-binding protein [Rubrivivax sp. A210]CAD5371945.1 Ferredoxin, 2Fe-2S [Rubrivivax sp. A210]